MSSDYIPEELNHQNVHFSLYKITREKVLGSDKMTEELIGELFANFKSRGGTESVVNGKLVIDETADIVTSWRPDISPDCLLVRTEDNAKFEIVGDIEDYSFMHIGLGFSVRRLKGKFHG